MRYRQVCELDGTQPSDDGITCGYEVAKETLVGVTDRIWRTCRCRRPG
ncbi:hypothetical protein [Streptomyces sp. NPDC003023]